MYWTLDSKKNFSDWRYLLMKIRKQRKKGADDWRKLHREELCDLYCSPDLLEGEGGGDVACMGRRAILQGST
jgi:hypothetical protein